MASSRHHNSAYRQRIPAYRDQPFRWGRALEGRAVAAAHAARRGPSALDSQGRPHRSMRASPTWRLASVTATPRRPGRGDARRTRRPARPARSGRRRTSMALDARDQELVAARQLSRAAGRIVAEAGRDAGSIDRRLGDPPARARAPRSRQAAPVLRRPRGDRRRDDAPPAAAGAGCSRARPQPGRRWPAAACPGSITSSAVPAAGSSVSVAGVLVAHASRPTHPSTAASQRVRWPVKKWSAPGTTISSAGAPERLDQAPRIASRARRTLVARPARTGQSGPGHAPEVPTCPRANGYWAGPARTARAARRVRATRRRPRPSRTRKPPSTCGGTGSWEAARAISPSSAASHVVLLAAAVVVRALRSVRRRGKLAREDGPARWCWSASAARNTTLKCMTPPCRGWAWQTTAAPTPGSPMSGFMGTAPAGPPEACQVERSVLRHRARYPRRVGAGTRRRAHHEHGGLFHGTPPSGTRAARVKPLRALGELMGARRRRVLVGLDDHAAGAERGAPCLPTVACGRWRFGVLGGAGRDREARPGTRAGRPGRAASASKACPCRRSSRPSPRRVRGNGGRSGSCGTSGRIRSALVASGATLRELQDGHAVLEGCGSHVHAHRSSPVAPESSAQRRGVTTTIPVNPAATPARRALSPTGSVGATYGSGAPTCSGTARRVCSASRGAILEPRCRRAFRSLVWSQRTCRLAEGAD